MSGPTWTHKAPIAEESTARDRQLALELVHGMRSGDLQCRAESRQTGKRCQRPATPWGSGVCKFHGSRSPQARKTIELRRWNAYSEWNRMTPMERAAHGVWWPVREVDFEGMKTVRAKEPHPATRTKVAAERKAKELDAWPDRKPLPPSWPPSNTAELLWGRKPGQSAVLPANVQIRRGFSQ